MLTGVRICRAGVVHLAGAARDAPSPPTTPAPTLSPAALAKACADIHRRGHDFAANYTALLVGLHNTFNGQPDALYATYGAMYASPGRTYAFPGSTCIIWPRD